MPGRVPSFYKKAAVIVHGKSEQCLVAYIYTNLHAPVKILSKNKGKESIQINALRTLLKSKPYKSIKAFAEEIGAEYDSKEKIIKDFKLFIIMDTDDCSEETKADYISGKLFEGCALEEYIVPIYNVPNLENVMMRAGIMAKKISDSEKGKYYSKYFPINIDPLSDDTVNEIINFRSRIENLKETNLTEFIDYCFSLI